MIPLWLRRSGQTAGNIIYVHVGIFKTGSKCPPQAAESETFYSGQFQSVPERSLQAISNEQLIPTGRQLRKDIHSASDTAFPEKRYFLKLFSAGSRNK